MSDKIRNFIQSDEEKLEKLIESNPKCLSVNAVADFLGCTTEAVRTVLENGNLGLAWRTSGANRHGYYIPTGYFVRWYMQMGG